MTLNLVTFYLINAIWVEFAHFVSYHLACYPNPNLNPNLNSNLNPYSNPKLGGLFHKMCELYLFSFINI